MANFTIPKEIIVGFRRGPTKQSDRFGFITHDGIPGNAPMGRSWDRWRDRKIETERHSNNPTTGFVINRRGPTAWGTFEKAEILPIYDPRGWALDISTDNLMQIIRHNGISRSGRVKGRLAYGWDYSRTRVSLVPEKCDDYEHYMRLQDELARSSMVPFGGARDLVVGNRYLFKNGKVLTYLGKFITHNLKYPLDAELEVRAGNVFQHRNEYHITQRSEAITHTVGPDPDIERLLVIYDQSTFNLGYHGRLSRLSDAERSNMSFKTLQRVD